MGDKYRSEVPKPVNNPLLSGAGQSFPFENFQGSSLLVPVSQPHVSILNDQPGEADRFVGQDVPSNEAGPSILAESSSNEQRNEGTTQASSNQSYMRFFSSFFGNGQVRQETEARHEDAGRKSDASASTPPTFSPYVQVPNFQTLTPALQVPSLAPDPGNQPPPTSEVVPDVAPPGHHPPPMGHVVQTEPASLFQPPTADVGAQGPPNPLPYPTSTSVPTGQQQFPTPMQPAPYYSSQSSFADMSRPPQSAPPPSVGDTSRSYRLSHNRRPVYAPIPGLSLTAPSTASFVQTSDVHPPLPQPSPYPNAPSPNIPQLPSSVPPPSANIPQLPSTVPPPSASNSQLPYPPRTPSNASAQSNVNPVASYFSSVPVSAGDSNSIQSPPKPEPTPMPKPSLFVPLPEPIARPGSLPKPEPPLVPKAETAPPSVPKPDAPPVAEQSAIFTPISKSTVSPSEVQPPVFNPVPVHPFTTTTPNLVNPQTAASEQVDFPPVVPPSLTQLAHVGRGGTVYRPPYYHWFCKKEVDTKEIWTPFSMTDSVALEHMCQHPAKSEDESIVATDGGRYDVCVPKRIRRSVYWEETPKEVRRCSWFYRNANESKFRPYDETTAYRLEEEYKKCVTTNNWKAKVALPGSEYIVMYSPTNIAHFEGSFPVPDAWEDTQDSSHMVPTPSKVVKRGILEDFDVDDGESPTVDHLVFVVHGIGSVCDLNFRTIEEAVDVTRTVANQLIKIHFSNSVKQGSVNRVEILPVSWHSNLHGETTGLDKKLESITLKSIPRLRNFTNDTLLDILFYTSPVYSQNIIKQVASEMETLLAKFKSRNPSFNGSVSLVGHSLGSLILFDMLSNQKTSQPIPSGSMAESNEKLLPDGGASLGTSNFVIGNAGTGQPHIQYPQLSFQPVAFFALGSPIGMFVTVRGVDSLGLDFRFPTCPRFLNIFHPFDPVAYRIEALINSELADKRPLLIPHHKGRKRMHLELKETIGRVGADLKQRLVDSIRSTWNTVYQLTAFGRADDGLEQELNRVIEKQIERSENMASCLSEQEKVECSLGQLNMGRRIDYVLQEAPLESFNEYVSAIRSHLIYWNSEDTLLTILKEIYGAAGIPVDCEGATNADPKVKSFPPSPSSLGSGWDESTQHKAFCEAPAPYGFKPN